MSETSVVAEEWGDFKLRADWREGLRSWVSGVYCVLSSSVMDGARGAGAGRLPSKQRGCSTTTRSPTCSFFNISCNISAIFFHKGVEMVQH